MNFLNQVLLLVFSFSLNLQAQSNDVIENALIAK
jgi:hypothetical protein